MGELKPIEEGCLAIIIEAREPYQGMTTTVGRCVGELTGRGFGRGIYWVVDVDNSAAKESVLLDCELLRIDDYQQSEEETRERELEHG